MAEGVAAVQHAADRVQRAGRGTAAGPELPASRAGAGNRSEGCLRRQGRQHLSALRGPPWGSGRGRHGGAGRGCRRGRGMGRAAAGRGAVAYCMDRLGL